MSRGRLYGLFVLFAVSFPNWSAAAESTPTISLLSDWGRITARVWFEDAEASDWEYALTEGPVLPGLSLELSDTRESPEGFPQELWAHGQIRPLSGSSWMELYTFVEPQMASMAGRGWSQVEFMWRFEVGETPIDLYGGMWATGGLSRFYLFDETAETLLMDTGPYQGFGQSISHLLLPDHVYSMQAMALADATYGGDPTAGVELFSTATIERSLPVVPEPTTLALLAAGGTVWLGRRRVTRG